MAKRIGVLWVKQSKDKVRYHKGTLDLGALGNVEIAIFPNKDRKNDKAPDYYIVLSEPAQAKPEEKVPAEDPEDDPPF